MSRIIATAAETAIITTWLFSLEMEKAKSEKEKIEREGLKQKAVNTTVLVTGGR